MPGWRRSAGWTRVSNSHDGDRPSLGARRRPACAPSRSPASTSRTSTSRCRSAPACRRSRVVGPARQGGRRIARAGAQRARRDRASACRPSGSRSTWRPPTWPRRAAISICRSRSALLVGMGALPADATQGYLALGELALDGAILRVAGVLPAAVAASARELGLICPAACGGEAAWLGSDIEILATASLLALINHFNGSQVLSPPARAPRRACRRAIPSSPTSRARRPPSAALEIAAAGSHNLLLIGPPGAGKSMLAARLPGLLPPLDPAEILEVSMVAERRRPAPRRPPDRAAAVPQPAPRHLGRGDGRRRAARAAGRDLARAQGRAVPGRAAGVPPQRSWNRCASRSRLGRITVARANHHVTYPARFQLVAAMNPAAAASWTTRRSPAPGRRAAPATTRRGSPGPLFDRIDLHVEVPALSPTR